MSSLKMHLAVSDKIKREFNFSDAFLLGAILPDIFKVILKEKDVRKSHFEEYGKGQYLPNIEKFFTRYKDQKNEIIYGYLLHLVQDRLWFSKYVKKYAAVLNENEYVYLKDNTIHTSEEYNQDIYADYSIIDKYITQKYNINIDELKKSFRKIIKDKKIIEVLENKLIDYKLKKAEIIFFTKQDAEMYYIEAYNESKDVLTRFMNTGEMSK